jgi:hypothetical protein
MITKNRVSVFMEMAGGPPCFTSSASACTVIDLRHECGSSYGRQVSDSAPHGVFNLLTAAD